MSKFMRCVTGINFILNVVLLEVFGSIYDTNNLSVLQCLLTLIIFFATFMLLNFVVIKIVKLINDKIWHIISLDILKTCFK